MNCTKAKLWRATQKTLLGLLSFVIGLGALPAVSESQVLRGVLSERDTYDPIDLGLLTLIEEDGDTISQVLSDDSGFFEFEVPNPGGYYIIAAAVGYRAVQSELVQIEAQAVRILEIAMTVRPIPLPGFEIVSEYEEPERPGLAATGFYERAATGKGEVIWPGQIIASGARYVQPLFYGSQTATVRQTQHDRPGPWNDDILLRDLDGAGVWCSPSFYIDGAWIQELNPGESIADAVPMDQLLAIEMYQWPFYVPEGYQGWGDCGVVLFWTKRYGST